MTYRVLVVREHGGWLADVPDAHGAFTESDDLAGLDTYCREVVTLAEGLSESAMPDLDFEWVLAVTDADLADAVAGRRGVPRAEVLAQGWSLADVAAILNAPAERVVHVPPRAAAAAR